MDSNLVKMEIHSDVKQKPKGFAKKLTRTEKKKPEIDMLRSSGKEPKRLKHKEASVENSSKKKTKGKKEEKLKIILDLIIQCLKEKEAVAVIAVL